MNTDVIDRPSSLTSSQSLCRICDARSTILGHRAPLIHTWAPRPCFFLFPKFRSALAPQY